MTPDEAVRQLAGDHLAFTTDDVWALVGDLQGEPRVLGAVMNRAARAGLIEPTHAYRPSQRPACHRRPVRVWRSLVVASKRAVA